ncbi:replicative DNA helicase [Roseateles asaccharophilus]|uniref:replicative DNA helicase n=1 Tax=Roseateles asaccharophilus TaxID=582607 RepID=UPI003834A1A0
MKRANLLPKSAQIDDPSLIGEPPEGLDDGVISVVQPAVKMAERSIVGAALADNEVFDSLLDVVVAEDFSDPVLAEVFRAVGEIISGSVDGIAVADPISVASLPSVCQLASLDFLLALAGAGSKTLDAAISHAKIVATAAADRSLKESASKAQAISNGDGTLEERTAEVQQLLANAGASRALPVVSIGAAAVAALGKLAERSAYGKPVGVSTGFPELDALLACLAPGQVIVVGARPGVGKTAFALSMSLYAALAGTNVLFCSLEMKAEELSKRTMAMVAGVNSHALRLGALSEQDWEALADAATTLLDVPLNVVDLPSVNLQALVALARRMKREGRLDLLVVDYVQLLNSGLRHASREQEVAAVSRGLKLLAMLLEIPVVVLSQLNRGIESRMDKRPQKSDLRESGALEQDADVIMFVHREGAQAAHNDGGHMGMEPAEIIVEKQREGPPGIVELGYVAHNTKFVSKVSTNSPLIRQAA